MTLEDKPVRLTAVLCSQANAQHTGKHCGNTACVPGWLRVCRTGTAVFGTGQESRNDSNASSSDQGAAFLLDSNNHWAKKNHVHQHGEILKNSVEKVLTSATAL